MASLERIDALLLLIVIKEDKGRLGIRFHCTGSSLKSGFIVMRFLLELLLPFFNFLCPTEEHLIFM